LCLAQALLHAGFDVQVYERDAAPHARRQGYRITLDNHGLSALERCLPPGLFARFLTAFPPPNGVGYFRFTNRDLGEIFKLTFRPEAAAPGSHTPRQADRELLRAILLSGLEGRVHYGKAALRATTGSDGAKLHFADGSSTHASLVVGADGAGSALRTYLLPGCDPIDLESVGIYGRSALVRDGHSIVPEPLQGSGVLAVGAPGRGFFFTTMRFGGSTAEDYVMWAMLFPQQALPPGARELGAEALHRYALEGARDFHPVLRGFVECADIEFTMAVALYAAQRPPAWPVSRATLMGDAVHVMPPFGAHGGNTALRDAALLADKLKKVSAGSQPFQQAIGAYQEEMTAYAFREVNASIAMMRRMTTANPLLRWAVLRAIPWCRNLAASRVAVTTELDAYWKR
jgi:2-polyprenyl-6-methoxyphenol hydroxylase-like FAD-dependent oxidoreductase